MALVVRQDDGEADGILVNKRWVHYRSREGEYHHISHERELEANVFLISLHKRFPWLSDPRRRLHSSLFHSRSYFPDFAQPMLNASIIRRRMPILYIVS